MLKKILTIILVCTCLPATEKASIQDILSFWLGTENITQPYDPNRLSMWFGGNDPHLDQTIHDQFEDTLIRASQGELSTWESTPEGRLALILLLDQFPRNMYRNTPRAFSFDALARKLTLEGLSKGDDQKLSPIQKVFFYLPLEHAEDLQLQHLSVYQFQNLLDSLDDATKPYFGGFLYYAIEHQKQIIEWGRFPGRDKILNRP